MDLQRNNEQELVNDINALKTQIQSVVGVAVALDMLLIIIE